MNASTSFLHCQNCPAHTYSPDGSAAETDCLCNAGFTKEGGGGACVRCGFDNYKDFWGNGNCSLCPTHAGTDSTAEVQREACLCNAGYFGELGASCKECQEDHYCDVGQVRPCCSVCCVLLGSSGLTPADARPAEPVPVLLWLRERQLDCLKLQLQWRILS
eukprot:1091756-Rhodomonas_salina.1